MIVRLELPPGKSFSENELAEKLGISRSPVRAALARLQEDGFIENSGRVGLKTVDIDARYVRNVYEIRAVLEGLCARKSVKLIPDEEIDKLANAKDSTEAALRSGDSKEWDLLEPKFHDVIVDLCDNDMLKALLQRMRDHWDRIRNAHGHTIRDAKLLDFEENQVIIDAMRSRDPDRLQDALETHVSNVAARMLSKF